jgi:hypothetical protein
VPVLRALTAGMQTVGLRVEGLGFCKAQGLPVKSAGHDHVPVLRALTAGVRTTGLILRLSGVHGRGLAFRIQGLLKGPEVLEKAGPRTPCTCNTP